MEFKELWTLVEFFVKHDIKTCRCGACTAPIKDIYHLWTNNTEINVRLRCENDHYDWHSIPVRALYTRYNDKLKQVEVVEQQPQPTSMTVEG